MLINTRPKELSNKIIEICNTENIEIENVPLSKIEFYSDEINSKIYDEVDKKIHNFSNLIFTSQAAAKYGANLLNSKLCFDGAKHNIFAVGEATKSILSEQGFEVIVPLVVGKADFVTAIRESGLTRAFVAEFGERRLEELRDPDCTWEGFNIRYEKHVIIDQEGELEYTFDLPHRDYLDN